MFRAIDRVLSRIKELHDHITIGVSIDGIGSMHDYIRGIPGAFQLVERTMNVLKKYPNIRRNISMVVTNLNFSHFLK